MLPQKTTQCPVEVTVGWRKESCEGAEWYLCMWGGGSGIYANPGEKEEVCRAGRRVKERKE